MDDFLRVLCVHGRTYRHMQPQDAVKLAYQSVFGGGHMIPDAQAAMDRLQAEYDALPPGTVETPLIEEIGGGMVRLHLAALNTSLLPLDAVHALFLRSAAQVQGTREELLSAIEVIKTGCREGYLPFSMEALDAYLTEYLAAGMPMVSHSAAYRAQYRPAYRIIQQEYVPYLSPIGTIYRQLREKGRVVVAIEGMAGSGKTTLAKRLSALIDGVVISMDDFFLPPEKRTAQRLAEAGGNVDHERFAAEVLPGLHSGAAFAYGVFDCSQMAVTEMRQIPAATVRIVEGSYAMHPTFGRYADVTLFLHISPQEQMRRITCRNGVQMAEKFRNIWIPMENRYFREKRIAERCRYVIENDND